MPSGVPGVGCSLMKADFLKETARHLPQNGQQAAHSTRGSAAHALMQDATHATAPQHRRPHQCTLNSSPRHRPTGVTRDVPFLGKLLFTTVPEVTCPRQVPAAHVPLSLPTVLAISQPQRRAPRARVLYPDQPPGPPGSVHKCWWLAQQERRAVQRSKEGTETKTCNSSLTKNKHLLDFKDMASSAELSK